MSPFRFLILAALGYILYRRLMNPQNSGPSGSAHQGRREPEAVDDVLVEDPVCHTYIPQQGAESWTLAGTTHYFCSPECRKKYVIVHQKR